MKIERKCQTHPWSMSWKKRHSLAAREIPFAKMTLKKQHLKMWSKHFPPKKGCLATQLGKHEQATCTHKHTCTLPMNVELQKLPPARNNLVKQMFQPHTITEQSSFLSFPLKISFQISVNRHDCSQSQTLSESKHLAIILKRVVHGRVGGNCYHKLCSQSSDRHACTKC